MNPNRYDMIWAMRKYSMYEEAVGKALLRVLVRNGHIRLYERWAQGAFYPHRKYFQNYPPPSNRTFAHLWIVRRTYRVSQDGRMLENCDIDKCIVFPA